MKVLSHKLLATVAAFAVSITTAQASPAFARQMNMDCMGCHYQTMPKLNAFGREFKLSGFTMTARDVLTSDASGGLNIPSNMNFGFVTKARAIGSDSHEMYSEIFDEAAFIFGGRVSEHIGTSMEFGEGLIGGKFVYSRETLGGRAGISYSMTDALGAFNATEIYSSGLYRPIRQFENRKGTNIFQKTGIGDGEATGVSMFISTGGLYATVGAYMPTFGATAESGLAGYKTLARAAYETQAAGFELSFGGYYLGGDVTKYANVYGQDNAINGDALDRESYGIDMQLQGDIAGKSLMITAGWVLANTYSADGNTSTSKQDNCGVSIDAQLNVTDTIGIKVAYMDYTDKVDTAKSSKNLSGGLEYNWYQNVRLALEYTNSTINNTNHNEVLFMSMIAF